MTHTIRKIGLTISGITFLFLALFAQSPLTIVGKWKGAETPEKQMEFFQQKDGSFASKVINDISKESKNGALILRNLKFDNQTKSFKGKMSPPDMDIELAATVSFVGDDKLEVKASKLFMTKTIRLIRIK